MSGGSGGGGGGGGGAMISGGAIVHLVPLVSVCLCCKLSSLCRLNAISAVTMVFHRPVLWFTCPFLPSPPPCWFPLDTHMCLGHIGNCGFALIRGGGQCGRRWWGGEVMKSQVCRYWMALRKKNRLSRRSILPSTMDLPLRGQCSPSFVAA